MSFYLLEGNQKLIAQSAGAVEYTDCTSGPGYDTK